MNSTETNIPKAEVNRLLMLMLLMFSLTACGGRLDNLPRAVQPVTASEILPEVIPPRIFRVTNSEELYSAVETVNALEEAGSEVILELTQGDYHLGSQRTEISNKHLHEEGKHMISTALSINTDSAITIKAIDPLNKPRLIADGVENDVILHIQGKGDLNISDIEIHTIPEVLGDDALDVDFISPVRSAIYVEGEELSGRNVRLENIGLFDNVDRSVFVERHDIEYSGIVIKNAQRVDISNTRLERFYLDGISLFNVFSAFVSDVSFLRDANRMRTGSAIGHITTGTSVLDISDIDVTGYYKGVNIFGARGFSPRGNTLIIRDSEFHNNGGVPMLYLTNATLGQVSMSNVVHDGYPGAEYVVFSANSAKFNECVLSVVPKGRTLTKSPEVIGIDGGDIIVSDSKINSLGLKEFERNLLLRQGFIVND